MENPFLHKKYKDLQQSEEVKKAVHKHERLADEAVPNDPEKRIEIYLTRLERIFLNPDEIKRERNLEMVKPSMHEAFIIKPGEVPERYFALQQKITREQGHGDVEIGKEVRQHMIETLIADQRESLDAWIDYLSSPDATYPTWLKYFTMRSIVGLSSYDKEKHVFKKRSTGTTAPFPDINREALAYVFDALEKKYGEELLEDAETPELQSLLKNANFGELYAYAIDKCTPASKEEKEVITGAWVTYAQGSDPKPLYVSLQGHGTGWCTAGESTAKQQLEAGDFHVFYSTDASGKNTIPRIAIRMQGDEIAEVRGINGNQELEPALIDSAKEKMGTLPGRERYEKKSADMKTLTVIERRVHAKEDLTMKELRFLYEIDIEIEGFGYKKDPRIEEIRQERNKKQDYATIFGCIPNEVSLSGLDSNLNDGTIIAENLYSQDVLAKFPKNLKYVVGRLDFSNSGLQSKNLGQLESISGDANFRASQLQSLGQLKNIGGEADFRDSHVADLGELESIGGGAMFAGSQIKDLKHLKRVGGSANFEQSQVQSLGELQYIGGTAFFGNSQIKDLGQLESIGGGLDLTDSQVQSLGKLKSVGEGILVDANTTLDFSNIKHGGIVVGR